MSRSSRTRTGFEPAVTYTALECASARVVSPGAAGPYTRAANQLDSVTWISFSRRNRSAPPASALSTTRPLWMKSTRSMGVRDITSARKVAR